MSLLLLGVLLAPPVHIEWDPSLAFERDRKAYGEQLRSIVDACVPRVSKAIGLPLKRALRIKVHTPAAYERIFGRVASQTRSAHYQAGAVHVNGGSRLDGRFSGVLEHEVVHAVLDHAGTSRRVPTWLNEGLGELLRYELLGSRRLEPSQAQEMRRLAPTLRLPMSQPMRGAQDYLISYAAVRFIDEKWGRAQLLRLVRSTLAKGAFGDRIMDELALHETVFRRRFVKWLQR